MEKILTELLNKEDVVVSGGARGVDQKAEEVAKKLGIETEIFLPDWDTYGKAAGFKRNTLIMEAADIIVCFWDGNSKGCIDTVKKAKAANKPYIIYGPTGEKLR